MKLSEVEEHAKIVLVLYNALKKVSPAHVDEFGLYDGRKKLLAIIFPAIQTYMSYSNYELDEKWLLKSDFLEKVRPFRFSSVNYVKAVSEEVNQYISIADLGEEDV